MLNYRSKRIWGVGRDQMLGQAHALRLSVIADTPIDMIGRLPKTDSCTIIRNASPPLAKKHRCARRNGCFEDKRRSAPTGTFNGVYLNGAFAPKIMCYLIPFLHHFMHIGAFRQLRPDFLRETRPRGVESWEKRVCGQAAIDSPWAARIKVVSRERLRPIGRRRDLSRMTRSIARNARPCTGQQAQRLGRASRCCICDRWRRWVLIAEGLENVTGSRT